MVFKCIEEFTARLNSSSFNVNTPTLIHMKYYSIDGDLANTYVSITNG